MQLYFFAFSDYLNRIRRIRRIRLISLINLIILIILSRFEITAYFFADKSHLLRVWI